jgi:hypothetical protein
LAAAAPRAIAVNWRHARSRGGVNSRRSLA